MRVFGPDLDALRKGADTIAASVRGAPGVKNARVEQQVFGPEGRF